MWFSLQCSEEESVDQLVEDRRNAIKGFHGQFFAAIKEPIVFVSEA